MAQINENYMLGPELLAQWDARMINEFTFGLYFKLMLLTVTVLGAGSWNRVVK